LVFSYRIILISNKKFIQITLLHNRVYQHFDFFKLISKPSKSYFLSLHSIKLINKRLGASLLILSTSNGYLTHLQALEKGVGGEAVGLF
jgi:ribosomal protein S8